MDPSHIAPSRSDSNSNGHFPLNTHGQMGTPRGFSLNNLQHINHLPNLPPGAMPNPMQMAALLSTVNGGNTLGGAGDDRFGGVGPVRRGGNRYGQSRAGPYDRPKDGRNQRWNNGGPGRLSPPRNSGPGGLPRGGGVPRYDGQGAGAQGSREAVQGRSLKSYEDLDADGGAGTGALDY